MAVDTDLLPPRYRGATLIGHGGMGDIYRATDQTLGREVAIKLLAERYADDPAIRGRFTREALAAARLSGESNAVTIFDVGEWNGRAFIVMEHLAGGSLEQRLRDGGAEEPGQVVRWLEQAARALDAAHSQGIVHRDVKPGNLLLDREGNVHVADFGIATAAGLDSLTQTGTIIGTAGYLSPEQAQGARATPASDVYALAVVAFELLTGERPFQNESTTAEAAAHVHAPIPSVAALDPTLPPELDAVFERALAKDPAERYPTCGAFVAALRRALDRPTAVMPTPTPAPGPLPFSRDRAGPGRRRIPLLPIAVALLLLLGATGAVAAALLAGDGDEQTRATTFVTTVREQGTTERVTVTTTTEAPPPPQPQPQPTPPPAVPPPPAASGQSGEALTDQSTALLNQGRWEEALAVGQQALAQLRGTGKLYEAYANYDVGRALVELGRCDEAVPYLNESERIQGPRGPITAARARCQGG